MPEKKRAAGDESFGGVQMVSLQAFTRALIGTPAALPARFQLQWTLGQQFSSLWAVVVSPVKWGGFI